ncbi:MAG: HYR domain-containing protein [Flavobacteriaceae bacterium]
MKKILLLLAVFLPLMVFSQGRIGRIAEDVVSTKIKPGKFKPYELFNNGFTKASGTHKDAVRQGIVLDFSPAKVADLVQKNPREIELTLPINERGETVTLELIQKEIFSSNFRVRTSDGQDITNTIDRGKHYRGIVAGKPHSLVGISIFNNEVMGFISFGEGNYVIGRLQDSQSKHIIYNERDLLMEDPFSCTTPDDGVGYSAEQLQAPQNRDPGDVVCIYIEAGQSVFNAFGGNLTNTTNFLNGVFANCYTLYANEGIPMQTSEMFIWTTADPYNGANTGQQLSAFQAQTSSINGNLGHLVEVQNIGGLAAGFSGICAANVDDSLCFSGFSGTSFNTVPTFSFNVMIITHEMGHLLGSRHTHACVWNGNNTAIDGCAGFTEGGCPLPPSPPGGGTIMSYCHNDPVGVDFTQGFGPQPGAVVLNTVNTPGNCLIGTCSAAPANDLCANAQPMNCGDTVAGDTTMATFDGVGTCTTSNTAPGVWYSFTAIGPSATLSTCNQAAYDTKISVFSGSCGTLVCVGGNDDGPGCSGFTSQVTVPTTPGTTYLVLVHGFASAVGTFNLTLTCAPPAVPNDFCTGAISMNCGDTVTGDTTSSTIDNVGFCGTSNTAPGVWYSFAGFDGQATLSTCNQAGYDTKISVFSGSCGSLVCEGGNDDGPGCSGFTSLLDVCVSAGETYYVLVHGFGSATGTFDLTLTCSPSTVAVTCPPTMNIEGCGIGDAPLYTSIAAFQAAGGTVTGATSISMINEVTSGTCPVTVTRTYEVSDDCGFTATCDHTVTVDDTTLPVITCPADATVECSPGGIINGTNTANYTGPTISWGDSTTGNVGNPTADLSGIPGGATITDVNLSFDIDHSWVGDLNISLISPSGTVVQVIDNVVCGGSGNSDNVSATFDDAAGGPTSASCIGGVSTGSNSETCPGNYAVNAAINSTYQPDSPFSAFNGEVAAGTWTLQVNDDVGGDGGCLHNFSVEVSWTGFGNNTDPSITGTATATDNCNATVTYSDASTPMCGNTETITRTWTATDDCGNSVSCDQIITVVDTTFPTVTNCPGDISVGNDPGICGAVVNYTAVTGTDTCGNVTVTQTGGLASGSVFPVGTTVNTFDITDDCGNTSNCTFSVTVADTEPPVAVCQDITVQLDINGNATILPSDVDGGSTDNCTIPANLVLSVSPDTFTCADATTPGSDFALDFDGVNDFVSVPNASASLAGTNSFTLEGWVFPRNTAPNFPNFDGFFGFRNESNADIYLLHLTTNSVEARFRNSSGVNFDVVGAGLVVNQWQHLSFTYDGANLRLYINGNLVGTTPASGNFTSSTTEPFYIGQTLFFGTPFRLNGQVDEVRFWNVARSQAEILASMNLSLVSPQPGLVMNYTIEEGTGSAITADETGTNANGALQNMDPATDWVPGAPISGGGGTTVTLTVTDEAGNASSCNATVTVVDSLPPTISCPMDITVDNDPGVCGAQVFFADAIAIDNCGVASVEQTAGDPSGSVFPIGSTTIEYTATDVNGNSITCSFTITVNDTEAPMVTCSDLTVELDASGNVTVLPGDVATATDNCPGVMMEFLPVGGGPGSLTTTFSTNNGSAGNMFEVVPLVDLTIESFDVNNTSTTTVDYQIYFKTGTYIGSESNAGDWTLVGTASGVPGNGQDNPTPLGLNMGVALTAGNTYSFYVADVGPGTHRYVNGTTEGALWASDANLEVYEGAGKGGLFTTTFRPRNFSGNIVYNIAAPPVPSLDFTCADVGDNTVTVIATDAAGNTSTCTAVITVEDNTAPVIACIGEPVDVTDTASDSPGVAIPDNDTNGVSTTLTVTDDFIITDLNVDLDISHTWVGDIDVTLESPSGTTVTILDRPGVPASTFGCSGNDILATLDDEAGSPVEDECGAGVPTINGSFTPNNPLSAFDGESTLGTWTLTVRDNAGGDTGTINTWGISYSHEVVSAPYEAVLDGTTGTVTVNVADLLLSVDEACGYTVTTGGGAPVPGTITTLFDSNNGGSNGGAIYFDVTVGPQDINITDMDINTDEPGAFTMDIYTLVGSYVGNTGDPGAWTLSATASGTASGTINVPSNAVLGTALTLTAGTTYGMALVLDASHGHSYSGTGSDPSPGSTAYSNADLALALGAATNAPFDGSPFSPRVFNGTINYLVGEPASTTIEFDCSDLGENQVEVTVTDDSGNTATCTATVNVVDITDPILVCMDATVELDENGMAEVTPDLFIDTAASFDACGITITAVDVTDVTCDDIGTSITVTVFASDASGNLASCTATLTVVDAMGPMLENCPADTTVDPGPLNLFYELPDYWATAGITATDNCTDPVTVFTQDPAPGTLLPDGVYTINVCAEDEYGNVGCCTFELTVESVLGNEEVNFDIGTLIMYPNPANNIVNIANPQAIPLNAVSIYDVTGRLVNTYDVRDNYTEISMDISNLASATYLVVIQAEKVTITKQLIKE